MSITHKHLEAFQAVIQLGGFTRAAVHLRSSQPSISRLVAQLQRTVGFPLFSRIGGQARPTAEALALLQEVERSFTGIDKVMRHADRIRTHRVGHLRVLSMPALAHSFLPKVLAGFLRDHPGVSASLQVQRSEAIADWMTTRQFDVGFAITPPERIGLSVELFDAAPGVCVMRADHPLARKRVVAVRDLDGVALIGNGPGSMLQRGLSDLFAEARVVPEIAVETPISAIACEMAMHGAGVAVVDPYSALDYRARGLAVRPLRPTLHFPVSAIYPEGEGRSNLVCGFLAAMAEARDALAVGGSSRRSKPSSKVRQ